MRLVIKTLDQIGGVEMSIVERRSDLNTRQRAKASQARKLIREASDLLAQVDAEVVAHVAKRKAQGH